ncbi:MAG: LptF/LptG family permease [Verrucomicrobia bacterium]|nr:LptF/LptG family permease [Verrucomicrobiota bacterium]
MVKIIDRYISSQIITTLTWTICMLSLMLVVANAMRQLLELLMTHGLPLSYIFSFIGDLLPFSMIYSIPWGVLLAVLLVFGKLSSENELVALRANGIGILRICAPVFLITLGCLALCLWINLYVAPECEKRFKELAFNLASTQPLALFGSDEVIDAFPNRKIYVGRKNGNTLEDLHIYEMNAQQVPVRVIYAKRGTLEVDKENQRILLRIFDARYEDRDESDVNDLKRMHYGISVEEGVFPISLQELIAKAHSNQRPTELTLSHLREAMEQKQGKQLTILRTELSKRFSNSMAVITFVLVGIPLAITAHRRETSIGIGISICVAFTYFIFIVLTDNVKSNASLHPEILIWLPNVVYLTLGGTLFYRLARR